VCRIVGRRGGGSKRDGNDGMMNYGMNYFDGWMDD
jgi:hypothetical protein